MNHQDRDAYEAIIATLKSTGALAAVLFGDEAEAVASSSTGQLPLVLVSPGPWQEVDHVDPWAATRLVQYTITIVVKDIDSFERFQEADRLSAILQEHLDGSDLGGNSLPALTRFRKGGPESNQGALELRYKLFGSFGYVIPDIRQRTAAS